MATDKTVLDREGEATVTKALRMAAAGTPGVFAQFQRAVEVSGLPLETCVTKAMQLFADAAQ